MGIFNFFIVLPEILAALTFGPLVKNFLGGNLIYATMAGGAFMLIAALITLTVPVVSAQGLERVAEKEGMLPTVTPPETPAT